ncbi:MAG: WD40 repeat domain-containing protein [Proteobacteria bacterium]|jgi:WD40 repeat protein|nr:WD40 repeat domain-containing protein [Pseudomonadota bacterium]
MRRRHHLGLSFVAALAVGCGAAETTHQPALADRESVVAHLAADPADLRKRPEPRTDPAQPELPPPPPAPDPPPPALSEPPLRIFLEPDLDMLETTPPAGAPQRYRSWRQRARISVGHSHLDTALTSPDEKLLLVRSAMEATIRIYDRKSRALLGNYPASGFAAGGFERGDVAFWPDPERGPAFVVGNLQGIALYSATTGERMAALSDRPAWQMRWSPDGRFLLCAESDIETQTSVLTIFRRGAGPVLEEVRRVPLEARLDGWALSADNRFLAATYYPSDTLELIDLHTGEILWRIQAPTYSSSVDFSPDMSRVAIGGNRLIVMDRALPSVRAVYEKFGNNIHKVRFSPSGDAIAASSYDGHLRILSADPRAKGLKLLKDLRHGGTANVYSATFLKDGSGIISSSGDETVRIWGR